MVFDDTGKRLADRLKNRPFGLHRRALFTKSARHKTSPNRRIRPKTSLTLGQGPRLDTLTPSPRDAMKSFHPQREQQAIIETARLVREVDNQAGEDNVIPWLLVHQTLVQAALRGCKYGLKAAYQRSHEQCN
jgi:hypothetical protein